MANYQLLKADIDAKVYQNGHQEITGENLNSVLNAMVTTLGAEYQFAGVATTTTNPGSPDAKVFYIANGKGTYTNFGGLEVTEDDVVVLYYDTEWHKVSTGIASNEKLTELETKNSQLGQEIKLLAESGSSEITKTLNWQNGYVNTNGEVVNSSLSAYAVVPMQKGESVIIGTNNANITIIGWTPNNSVSIGDTINILQKTTGAGVYEEYSYTCQSNVNLVLCVRISDYNCSFFSIAPIFAEIQEELDKIAPIENSIIELDGKTIQENQFEHLYIDNIDGVKSNVIFYKQYVKIDDTSHTSVRETIFTLTDVAEGTYLFSADKVDNYAYAGYLWVVQKNANDETIAESHIAYAGQILTVSVVSGCKKILFQLTPAYGTALSVPCEYYGIRVVSGNAENYHLTGRFKDVITGLHEMNGFAIPEYYFKDGYLQNKVARINELHDLYAMAGTSFVFITDEHWEHPKYNAQNSMSLLRYIYNNTHLDTLVDGGDNADKGSVGYCDLLRKAWGGHIYHLAGNHDYMNGGDEREAELFSMFDSYNYNQIGNKERHYYYVDNERDKVRLVVLNAFKPSGSPSVIAAQDGYESEQIDWASNVAFNVPAGWKIIVLGHGLYGFYDPDEPDPYEGWGEHIYTPTAHQAVINLLDNYTGNGEILAFFSGHSHIDRVVYTPIKHIPVIHTNCDANTVSRHKTADPRTSGTIGEQCFDVVIYDSVGRKFHMVRIGTPAYNGIGTNVGTEVQEREVYVDMPLNP